MQTKNTLTLKPIGGLCNRLMAIDSAISLCEKLELSLKVVWIKDKWLNAGYSDLFESLEAKIPVEVVEFESVPILYSDKTLAKSKQRLYNAFLKLLQKIKFDFVLHGYEVQKILDVESDLGTVLPAAKQIYLAYWRRLLPGKITKNRFIPTSDIAAGIQDLSKKIGQGYIAIHIRRGDHSLVIKESPLQLFIDKIEQYLRHEPSTIFFLASDSMEAKKEMKKLYDEAIFFQMEEEGDRKSTYGMKKAVIDLFLLSKSKELWGNSTSTFIKVASEIGNIQLKEVKISSSI